MANNTQNTHITLFAAMIFLLFCCGCSDHKTPLNSITVPLEISSLSNEGEVILVSESNRILLGLERVDLDIVNLLNEEIVAGDAYRIQVLRESKWAEAFDLGFFDTVGRTIAPNSSRSFQCSLLPEQHEYVAGKYRILKEVSVNNSYHTISIEFELE